jgi:hypothetical protein
MNDRGMLTTVRRLAEKAGESVIDLDGEHETPLSNDECKTVRQDLSMKSLVYILSIFFNPL